MKPLRILALGLLLAFLSGFMPAETPAESMRVYWGSGVTCSHAIEEAIDSAACNGTFEVHTSTRDWYFFYAVGSVTGHCDPY